MEFEDLLAIVGDEPVFESGLLLAGQRDPKDVRRQLSRWVAAGKLLSLRRGLYALAQPYRKVEPHPFLVSNRLVTPSYVSLQAALAHHGLIPEAVPAVTAVTTRRPGRRDTPLGRFLFRHIDVSVLFGQRPEEVAAGQQAWVATAEKALLDLVYLTPAGDRPAFLAGLRLQGLEALDGERLQAFAERFPGTKMQRAARSILELAAEEDAAGVEL
jgi:predicted transcriptional regulator of viral defense system